MESGGNVSSMMMDGRDCSNLRSEAFLEDIEWCRHDGGFCGVWRAVISVARVVRIDTYIRSKCGCNKAVGDKHATSKHCRRFH